MVTYILKRAGSKKTFKRTGTVRFRIDGDGYVPRLKSWCIARAPRKSPTTKKARLCH